MSVIYHKFLLRFLIMLEDLFDFSDLNVILRSTVVRIVNANASIRLYSSSSSLKSDFLAVPIFKCHLLSGWRALHSAATLLRSLQISNRLRGFRERTYRIFFLIGRELVI